jgi:hypothetical protein
MLFFTLAKRWYVLNVWQAPLKQTLFGILLFILGVAMGVTLFMNASFAKDDKDKRKAAKPATQEALHDHLNRYTLAAGTTFVTTLETPLSSESNQVNDTLEMRLIHDVWVGNEVVIDKGSRFIGHVEKLVPPFQGRDALMRLQVHALETLEGEVTVMEGTPFSNIDDAGKMGGDATQPYAGRLIRYDVWGIGMYNRVMPAGPRAMGLHTYLRPGQLMRVRLDAPLTLVRSTDTRNWL